MIMNSKAIIHNHDIYDHYSKQVITIMNFEVAKLNLKTQ